MTRVSEAAERVARALCLLALWWGAAASGAAPQGGETPPWLTHLLKASAEHRAKNYPAAPEAARQAASLGPPQHPELTYHLARAYSPDGRPAEAARLLGGLAEMGLGVDVGGDGDFMQQRDWDGASTRTASPSPRTRGVCTSPTSRASR